jgi:DNA-binding response OmpR family regulator
MAPNHILLIEDNPLDIVLIQRYLEERSRQYALHIEKTLQGGFSAVQRYPIDLVLLDLSLPDSIGFRTLTNFLRKVKGIPVVVLTGTNNEIIGDQAVKAGAEDYLIKGDFDGRSLLRSIRYAQQRHKAKSKLEEAKNHLSRNEERYRHAEQLMHFGYLEMDLVSNQMEWTDELFRIFGLPPQSFSPTLSDYLNFVPDQERDSVRHFFDIAPTDEVDHQLMHRIILDGKRLKTLSLFARTRIDRETRQFSLAVAILDQSHTQQVTQPPQRETSTSHANEPAPNEFLSKLGFLVRTPLTSALQWNYLLQQLNLPAPADHYLNGLHDSLQNLSIAVQSLLNLSLIQSEEFTLDEESFQLEHLLNNLEALFSGMKIPHFHWEQEAKVEGMLRGDIARITHAIFGLGQFCLLHNPVEAQHIRVSTDLQSPTLWLHFDFPVSIDTARSLKHLIASQDPTPGTETPLEKELSSLHLTAQLSLQLINRLGGSFQQHTARSKKGRQLSISLPVLYQPSESAPIAPVSKKGLHILIVEDHHLNRIAIRRALENWDQKIQPDTAEDGSTALQLFEESTYDLVLMDLKLPDQDGWEVAKKMKQSHPTPIIAMSADREQEEIYQSRLWGFDAFLSKPFFTEELYRIILKTLG